MLRDLQTKDLDNLSDNFEDSIYKGILDQVKKL
jgi:hypothetical protein